MNMIIQETNRVITLEPISRAVTSVGKPCWTRNLIRSILTVFVAVTHKLHVNTVVAAAAELIVKTLAVFCIQQPSVLGNSRHCLAQFTNSRLC